MLATVPKLPDNTSWWRRSCADPLLAAAKINLWSKVASAEQPEMKAPATRVKDGVMSMGEFAGRNTKDYYAPCAMFTNH